MRNDVPLRPQGGVGRVPSSGLCTTFTGLDLILLKSRCSCKHSPVMFQAAAVLNSIEEKVVDVVGALAGQTVGMRFVQAEIPNPVMDQ